MLINEKNVFDNIFDHSWKYCE